MTPSRIYLIGLMGAGKSTLGRLLAEAMSWQFVDLDGDIESREQRTISEIFADDGEPRFRELEVQSLERTLGEEKLIVSCGGGILTSEAARTHLSKEFVIWLELSPEEAAHRLESSQDRPLLEACEDTVGTLSSILEKRSHDYAKAADLRVNTSSKTPENILKELMVKGKLI